MATQPNSENQEPILREHSFDGIQEYDQKLPNWWLSTLYGAIAYFIIYWLAFYQFGAMSTDEQLMQAASMKIEAAQLQELNAVDDTKLWAMSRDSKVVDAGKATFGASCIACHGPNLDGMLNGLKLPGLPLGDHEWKYGGNPMDVLKTVRKGSPDVTKGMPAWEQQLGVKRAIEVVAFVLSHHQEGEPITRAPDAPAQASNTTSTGS